MADEEDDDVLESWEDAEESEDFERRMEEHEKSLNTPDQEEIINMTSSESMTILKPENSGRTDYTPQIKILKRAAHLNIKKNAPKQKTEAELKQALKMKEAEYQAARNRILGENYDETLPKEPLEPEINSNSDPKISIIRNPNRSTPSSPLLESTHRSIGDINENKTTHSIIRQPRGPNENDTGFGLSR